MALRKIIEKPAPAPQKKRTQGATVIARKNTPKKLEPYVLQITCLHIPDANDQDVIFAHKGNCPSDIDPQEFEDYIAEFFGSEDEDDDDGYCESDDEFEE